MEFERRQVLLAGKVIGFFVLEEIDYPEQGHSCDCCVFHSEMGCTNKHEVWTDRCFSMNATWSFEVA